MEFKYPTLEFDLFNHPDFQYIGIDYLLKSVFFNLNIENLLDKSDFYQKIQLFISEVLSNYIKHSSAKVLRFKLDFYENYFVVNIYNNGNGFAIKDFKTEKIYLPPYPADVIGKDIILSCANNRFVCAHIKNENEIVFSKEPMDVAVKNIEIDELEEKYGISMITEMCEEVTYERKPKNTNWFRYYIKY